MTMPINNDPYPTYAKFSSVCKYCQNAIPRGARIYYLPKTKTVLCENCGKDEYEYFLQAAEDEYSVTYGNSYD